MLNNIKTRGKLILGYALIVALLAVAVAYCVRSSLLIGNINRQIFDQDVHGLAELDDVLVSFLGARVQLREAFIATTADEVQKYLLQAQEFVKANKAARERYSKTLRTEEDRNLLQEYEISFKTFEESFNNISERIRSEDREGARALLISQCIPTSAKILAIGDRLKTNKVHAAELLFMEAQKTNTLSLQVTIILFAVTLIIAVILSTLISKSIAVPLEKIRGTIDRIGNNDFVTVDVGNRRDEFGAMASTVNSMSGKLRRDVQLKNVIGSLVNEEDFEKTLNLLTDGAKESLGTQYGALAVYNEDGNVTSFFSSGFSDTDSARIGQNPDAKGLLGYAYRTRSSVRTSEITKQRDGIEVPPGHPPLQSLLSVPVKTNTTVYGNLYIAEKKNGSNFDNEDEISLQTLANLAAKIIAGQQTEQAMREKSDYLQETVRGMLHKAERLAQGDLTVEIAVTHDDELGQLARGLNRAIADIRTLLQQVQDVTEQATQATSYISSATYQMASTAEEQSAQTVEIASSIEESAQTSLENTRSATHVADLSQRSGTAAQQGAEVINTMMSKMSEIARVVSDTASVVSNLGAASAEIGEIVMVIEEIADQTNLLALNAAIEAARAGDQGRGFAVVADEVRKLAERTAQATKQIASTIRHIQRETERAVTGIERGNLEVQSGLQLAENASSSLNAIVSSAQEVNTVLSTIVQAINEQSHTSTMIARNTEQMSTSVQEMSQSVTEISRGASDLQSLMDNVTLLVRRFQIKNTHALSE